MAAVEALVELVSCAVFSVFDDVFSFFFQVVSALDVLTGYWNGTSGASHDTLLNE